MWGEASVGGEGGWGGDEGIMKLRVTSWVCYELRVNLVTSCGPQAASGASLLILLRVGLLAVMGSAY
jgi:hypothetical protein